MVFGFGKRRKRGLSPEDPLVAYDRLLSDLERQGAELRKSAATLLAVQGELTRDAERYERKRADIAARLEKARANGDDRVAHVLSRDQGEAGVSLEATRAALATAGEDAQLLMDAARELAERVRELRTERASARFRLTAAEALTAGLRQRVARFDQVVAVDAARDEVERAHALADIYREEVRGGSRR